MGTQAQASELQAALRRRRSRSSGRVRRGRARHL